MALPELLLKGNQSIEDFWRATSAYFRLPYIKSPRLLSRAVGAATPCGPVRDVFYCEVDNNIYYDYNFMNDLYNNIGDFAVITVLAHEWGHSVQAQLVRGWKRLPGFVIEQQADCFAGTYARAAEEVGLLDPGDREEAGDSLYTSGDARGTPPNVYGAHGKGIDRVEVFLYGYHTDAMACLCEGIADSFSRYTRKRFG